MTLALPESVLVEIRRLAQQQPTVNGKHSMPSTSHRRALLRRLRSSNNFPERWVGKSSPYVLGYLTKELW